MTLPDKRGSWPKTASASMATKIERRPLIEDGCSISRHLGGIAVPARGVIVFLKALLVCI